MSVFLKPALRSEQFHHMMKYRAENGHFISEFSLCLLIEAVLDKPLILCLSRGISIMYRCV